MVQTSAFGVFPGSRAGQEAALHLLEGLFVVGGFFAVFGWPLLIDWLSKKIQTHLMFQ